MRVKRDTITGLTGLTWSVIWLILIQVQTTQPANLLEPGPRLLLYVGFIVVFLSSLMLTIKGLSDWKKDPTSEEPYFPEGGKLKVARSYLMLVVAGVLMGIFGFLVIAPFSIFAFIYDLKGNSEVKPLQAAVVSILVTAGLYAMFVYGFKVKLPAGILFN